MLPFIYIIILFSLALLIVSFVIRDYVIGSIASMFMMILALHILQNGVLELNNFLTYAMAIIIGSIGGYVLIKGGIEFIETNFNG